MKAHDAFDRIWSHGTMSRTDAYRWMAEVLGTPAEEVHIASLDKEGCARVVEAVRSRFPDLFPIEPVDADP